MRSTERERRSKDGPILRLMRITDLPSVMQIDALCIPRPWSEAVWRDEIRSPWGLYLVLEESAPGDRAGTSKHDGSPGFICGQIGVRHVADELHITTVAVHPERRRRGYARTLLEAALATFPRTRRVHLEVRPSNGPARALYESLGFATTGRRRRYYGDEDALLMTLDLRP